MKISWSLRGYRIEGGRREKILFESTSINNSITHRTVQRIFNNPNFVLKIMFAMYSKDQDNIHKYVINY